MKLRAYIVDDELKAIKGLKRMIEMFVAECEVVGSATNINEAQVDLESKNIDLVFLDISLGKQNGFELLTQNSSERDYDIVFVTAYEQYAIDAIRNGAVDYILKPVDPDILNSAVARVKEKRNKWINLQKEFDSERLTLSFVDRQRLVALNDIIRIEANGSYSVMYINDGSKELISKRLVSYERLLTDKGFIRVHKSHLINKAFVDSFSKAIRGEITMKNGDLIPMSKTRKREVIDKLME